MGSPSQGLTRPGHFGTMPDNPEIWKAVAMADHFEKIQKLPDPIPGVPNFRRVPGYKAISTATDEDKAKHGLAGGKISTPGDQLKLAKTFVAWMEEQPRVPRL